FLHIITMTKQDTVCIPVPVGTDSVLTGDPVSLEEFQSREAEQNVLLRSAPLLGSSEFALPVQPASPRAAYREPVVQVSVLGGRLALPEHVLREGLSLLQLSTEGHVRLEDYAETVALVLVALAKRGLIDVRV